MGQPNFADDQPRRGSTPHPGCFRFRALVSDYVDQALTEASRDAMAEHLGHCPRCSNEVALESQLRARLRTSVPSSSTRPPLSLSDRLVSISSDASAVVWLAGQDATLPSPRRIRRQRVGIASGSAAALLLVLVLIGWCLSPELPLTTASSAAARGAAELGKVPVETTVTTSPSDIDGSGQSDSSDESGQSDQASQEQCPVRYICPPEMAGLELTAIRVQGDAVVLWYSGSSSPVITSTVPGSATSSQFGLVIVQQPGRLSVASTQASRGVESSVEVGVLAAVWQNDDFVFAAVSEDELVLKTAAANLPHSDYSQPSMWQRVNAGWSRLAHR